MNASESETLVLLQSSSILTPAEQLLTEILNLKSLPPQEPKKSDYRFELRLEQQGLTLYCTDQDAPGGLHVDLDSPVMRRRRAESLKSQNLGKALGLKRIANPSVLDATAGLGTDSLLMAAAGCRLMMMERNPVVHALLADGMLRAQSGEAEIKNIVSHMNLICGDFLEYEFDGKDGNAGKYDIVYLDPMFQGKKNSARAGKSMYLLQQLILDHSDEELMLEKALGIAKKRVVVKRARLTKLAGNKKPDISFSGSSNRYDVYLNH